MGNHSTGKRIEELANTAGFLKVRDRVNNHRLLWVIKCSKCAEEEKHSWGPRASPELMIKNMRQRHWDVGFAKEPLCPKHANERRHHAVRIDPTNAIKRMEKESMNLNATSGGYVHESKANEVAAHVVSHAPLPQQVSAAQPVVPNGKITRQVFSLLDDVFIEAEGRYSDGWDDKRIAKEVGTSEQVVAKLRLEAYGELKETPEIAEFRNQIASCEKQLKDMTDLFTSECTLIQRRISSLEIALAKVIEAKKFGR